MWKIQSISIGIDGQNVRYYWIHNFNYAYIIGDNGSLWTRYKGKGKNCYLSNDWTEMSPTPEIGGYLHVILSFNCVPYTRKIHKLVCEAVYGPCPVGKEVCHNDGNPLHNNWWNLQYGTRSKNQNDRVAHGTDAKGERCYNAKLTWVKVREIRVKYSTGKYSYKGLMVEYRVSYGCIHKIINNITWVEEYDLVT